MSSRQNLIDRAKCYGTVIAHTTIQHDTDESALVVATIEYGSNFVVFLSDAANRSHMAMMCDTKRKARAMYHHTVRRVTVAPLMATNKYVFDRRA